MVVNVVVNFLSQVIFIFPLFLGMVIYANEFETKEKQKLPEIKKINCNMNIKDSYGNSGKRFKKITTC